MRLCLCLPINVEQRGDNSQSIISTELGTYKPYNSAHNRA